MKTILIVDDEERIRSLYGRLMEKEGYQVFLANNAELAHEILLAHSIDLVLLDINLTDTVDGAVLHDVMEAFFKKTLVLVASVYPVVEQKKRIKGAAGYYDKSEGIQGLIGQVRSLLKRPSDAAAA
ncbi:MAG: response regulator [Desulfobacteraceae bacterium]|nr:MAG: response regulator [Desulfobacteraceae bacterium]